MYRTRLWYSGAWDRAYGTVPWTQQAGPPWRSHSQHKTNTPRVLGELAAQCPQSSWNSTPSLPGWAVVCVCLPCTPPLRAPPSHPSFYPQDPKQCLKEVPSPDSAPLDLPDLAAWLTGRGKNRSQRLSAFLPHCQVHKEKRARSGPLVPILTNSE